MRRLLFGIIILVLYYTDSMAQVRAVGGRAGYSLGFSQQYNILNKTMIQADVDLFGGWWGAQGTVTYNRIVPFTSWKSGELNGFLGIGIGGGCSWGGYIIEENGVLIDDYRLFGFVGAATNLGVEINFNSGFQLSVEWRPVFAPCIYKDRKSDFFIEGLLYSALAVGLRYKFN